jgi:hypothetical protein
MLLAVFSRLHLDAEWFGLITQSIVADVGCLVGILREIVGLLKAQDFQHAAVKVYIQLLKPLLAGRQDFALSAAMEELKTFVEPTTGLDQAVLWKALLLADNEKVEYQISQLMDSLMHTDACKHKLFFSCIEGTVLLTTILDCSSIVDSWYPANSGFDQSTQTPCCGC